LRLCPDRCRTPGQGADALTRHSFSGLRVCRAFQHDQFLEKLELNPGPEISNSQDDAEVTEIGRRFVGPPLVKTYCPHHRIDRENGEQHAFVKSIQTPLLQECLGRKPQRGCQAGQQERDRSEQSQDPSRAVRPFAIFRAQTLVIEKPFLFQPPEFMEKCLDEFGESQLGGGLGLKLDRAECISRHIVGHGCRGPLKDSPSHLPRLVSHTARQIQCAAWACTRRPASGSRAGGTQDSAAAPNPTLIRVSRFLMNFL
jgi:hypothetical protein